MIKTYHEAPKSLFKLVQGHTDGDYALVHLFAEDEEYYQMFVDALARGRDVILDNSVFELGKAAAGPVFADWVKLLKPTWYIVPDVLEDAKATVTQFKKFIKDFPDLPGKRIGVVQGKSLAEVIWCYKELEPLCDMVAFSFDFSWWQPPQAKSKWEAMAFGRIGMLEELYDRRVINRRKPHHLLGVALPQEMKYYTSMGWKWIRSVDTSNPVVHGLKEIKYDYTGLKSKESQKLFELINYAPTFEQTQMVVDNIKMFRRFCNEQ